MNKYGNAELIAANKNRRNTNLGNNNYIVLRQLRLTERAISINRDSSVGLNRDTCRRGDVKMVADGRGDEGGEPWPWDEVDDFGRMDCGEVRFGCEEFRAAWLKNCGQLRYLERTKVRQRGQEDFGQLR